MGELTASARLADHFTHAHYDELAEPLLHEMRRLLLDYCGVALAGSRSELTKIAGRVEIQPRGSLPGGVSCRMVVTLHDGTELAEQVDYPKGSTGNPMDDAQLAEKFRHLAEPVLGASRLDRAAAALWSADQSADLTDLLDALSPAEAVS